MQQTRTAFVYLPAGEPPAGGRDPTAYILDGTDYLNLIDAQALLEPTTIVRRARWIRG